jgi:hypothetical protein
MTVPHKLNAKYEFQTAAEGFPIFCFMEKKNSLYSPQKDLVVNSSLKMCELCNLYIKKCNAFVI